MAKKKPVTAQQLATAEEWDADVIEWQHSQGAESRLMQMERNVKRAMDSGRFRGFGRLHRFGNTWRTIRNADRFHQDTG